MILAMNYRQVFAGATLGVMSGHNTRTAKLSDLDAVAMFKSTARTTPAAAAHTHTSTGANGGRHWWLALGQKEGRPGAAATAVQQKKYAEIHRNFSVVPCLSVQACLENRCRKLRMQREWQLTITC
jgi:hypothetical protein